MKRIITIMSFGILALLASGTTSAKTYQWQLAQSWEKDSLFSEAVNRFVELSDQLSGGQLQVKVATQEDHGKPLEVFDLVQKGIYQMGHSESSYWRKKDRNTLFFSSVPFGMVTPELYSWFYHGGGIELMQRVYSKHGLLSFPGGNTGNQMVGWFRREVVCIAGLRGITMRMSGIAGEVMRNAGVNVIDMPSAELYPALDTGELDAVGYVGPAVDFELGFYKIAPFYYTGWNAPSSEMQFLINPDAFKALPKKLQGVVKKAMRLAAYDMYTKITHQNGLRLTQIRKDFPNIKFRAFPPDVMKVLNKESKRLIQDIADQGDDLTREIIASMDSYKKTMRVWTRIGDQAYLNNTGI